MCHFLSRSDAARIAPYVSNFMRQLSRGVTTIEPSISPRIRSGREIDGSLGRGN